jgi:hypothetical protein
VLLFVGHFFVIANPNSNFTTDTSTPVYASLGMHLFYSNMMSSRNPIHDCKWRAHVTGQSILFFSHSTCIGVLTHHTNGKCGCSRFCNGALCRMVYPSTCSLGGVRFTPLVQCVILCIAVVTRSMEGKGRDWFVWCGVVWAICTMT